MTAATQVFETYELLENIIVYLPPRSIRKASQVATTWRHIVNRSAHIRKARCIARQPDRSVMCPSYDDQHALALHPLLPLKLETEHSRFGHDKCLFVEFNIPHRLSEHAIGKEDYATEPPCSTLNLHVTSIGADCLIFAEEGVKLFDVIKTAKSMIESDKRYVKHEVVSNKPRIALGALYKCTLGTGKGVKKYRFQNVSH